MSEYEGAMLFTGCMLGFIYIPEGNTNAMALPSRLIFIKKPK